MDPVVFPFSVSMCGVYVNHVFRSLFFCFIFLFILFLFLDLCRLLCFWVAAPPLSLRWLRVIWGVVVVFGVGDVVFGDGDGWRL
jgi:hypothetical protein